MKEKSVRPNRIPVSDRQRDILSVQGKDPNKEYRWVNDQDGRIQRFMEGGWEVVNDPDVTIGQSVADSAKNPSSIKEKSVGQGKRAVLMAINKDWYDEDQQVKAQRVAEMEAVMKQDALNERYGKLEGGAGLEIKRGK